VADAWAHALSWNSNSVPPSLLLSCKKSKPQFTLKFILIRVNPGFSK